MTDHFSPSAETKARIQQLSQKSLHAFFNEVPAEAMRSLASNMPRVDGFRRGSSAGIGKQKEALARRLSRSGANEYDYKALYLVWRAWIDATQPNAPLIQQLVDELEEAADKAEGAEARRLVIEEHTNSLLRKLKEESEENRSTRESIQKIYDFSLLPPTNAALEIIAAAKPAADVERDSTFRNLPSRLIDDEREIQSIKSQVKVLSDRVGSIAEQSAKVTRELPPLRDAVRAVRSFADATRASVNEHVRDRSAHGRDDNGSTMEARIKALAGDVGKLHQSVSQYGDLASELRQVALTVQKLGETQSKLNEHQNQQASRIDQVAAALEKSEQRTDQLPRIQAETGALAALAEQMADLSRRVDTAVGRPQLADQTPKLVQQTVGVSTAMRCTPLPASRNASAITSYVGLVTAFADVLVALGMRKSAAQLLAEECAAAVAARQAIFLQGAFASRVARMLAAVAGGATAARLAMPIGLQEGEQVRSAVEEAFSQLKEGVGGLALEGFNHVPLDLTQEVLADCVGAAIWPSGLYRRIAVFATLSQGVAALPIEPELLKLGPVFDLDYLDWRTNPEGDPSQPPPCILDAKTDQALLGQVTSQSANAEEALHLARVLVQKRDPAFERTVVRAYQALHLVRSGARTNMPLYSLLYGWLIPYWRSLRVSRERIQAEIAAVKLQGDVEDVRLIAMLAADFSDNAEDGAP